MDWLGKWLVDFNAEKSQFVSSDRSNITGGIDIKLDKSVIEGKSSFKMLDLSFSSKLDCGSYIIFIVKTASKKIGALILSIKFFSSEVALYLYISTIRPGMNTVVMSWLVLLAPTWKC